VRNGRIDVITKQVQVFCDAISNDHQFETQEHEVKERISGVQESCARNRDFRIK
jgi:hypothetical protein